MQDNEFKEKIQNGSICNATMTNMLCFLKKAEYRVTGIQQNKKNFWNGFE